MQLAGQPSRTEEELSLERELGLMVLSQVLRSEKIRREEKERKRETVPCLILRTLAPDQRLLLGVFGSLNLKRCQRLCIVSKREARSEKIRY